MPLNKAILIFSYEEIYNIVDLFFNINNTKLWLYWKSNNKFYFCIIWAEKETGIKWRMREVVEENKENWKNRKPTERKKTDKGKFVN